MENFLTAIAAGGDIAMVAIAVALWKFDRRLFGIEQFLKHKLNYGA